MNFTFNTQGVNYIPSQNPKRIEKLSDGRLQVHAESGQEFGPYDQVGDHIVANEDCSEYARRQLSLIQFGYIVII